jgi:DNA-directed RNA polymerase specialized sigma24 family protein
MSQRHSDQASAKLVNETVRPSNPAPIRVKPDVCPFGLSPAQFARVTRAMLAVVRLVGRHSAVSPRDAVQQAWVEVLSKPETKRPSTHDLEKFVSYMCTLAKYEALTNRQTSLRRQQREIAADADVAEWVVDPNTLEATEARLMLEGPFMALEPEEQALLHALYHEGKTIEEIKDEHGRAWTTIDSRRKQLLNRLYAAIQALVAMLLLAPKKARAFVASAKQHALPMLGQATHVGGTIAITGICGVLVPTGSSLTLEASNPSGLTQVDRGGTNTTKEAAIQPSFVPEVAREEPDVFDAETNTCSPSDMRCTKVANSVAENLMPMTFLLGVALSQVACASTKEQTPSAQQPEDEPDGSLDPYDMMCIEERGRGNACPTREEWYDKFGFKPDKR